VGTDISSFINNLPFDKNTQFFSTKDASGSTSQAANICEALEVGATSLLVDEDTCATNFMIRDARMQALVSPDKEPITPFIQKIRPLFEERQVSTVMVIGGSGDFFELATTVIQMERYVPCDVTERALAISREMPNPTGIASRDSSFGDVRPRYLLPQGLAADGKVMTKSLRCISYGDTEVELSNVEQLVEVSQAKAIADALQKLGDKGAVDGRATLKEVVDRLYAEITGEACDLDRLSRYSNPNGSYALPRKFEIAAAVSRLRTAQASDSARA
jgi:predicted ABC-class ATPase